MNTKTIPIILLVVILGIGFIAFTFYDQKEKLAKEKEGLLSENTALVEEANELKYKFKKVEREAAEAKQKLAANESEMATLQTQRATLERKMAEMASERDALIEKVKAFASKTSGSQQDEYKTVSTGEISENHWADFVKKKASLQVELDNLNSVLLETKSKLVRLDKENKELSIRIDQYTKEKERLIDQVKFKERTLRVMSMDLVSEREERSSAVRELSKLRSENVSLKRELVLGNKEQMKLQDSLKSAINKKESLENRMSEAENVLKEKALAFDEFENQLASAISGGRRITASESASVELPPIVVKPSAPGLRGVRGEIIAVNIEEKFAVMDIGEVSGLRPGVLLKVIRGDREIATVEVIETRKEISAADIKEVVGGFTIQEGDIVISR